jgi:hypothetical protein
VEVGVALWWQVGSELGSPELGERAAVVEGCPQLSLVGLYIGRG